jgi:hypothetical protein
MTFNLYRFRKHICKRLIAVLFLIILVLIYPPFSTQYILPCLGLLFGTVIFGEVAYRTNTKKYYYIYLLFSYSAFGILGLRFIHLAFGFHIANFLLLLLFLAFGVIPPFVLKRLSKTIYEEGYSPKTKIGKTLITVILCLGPIAGILGAQIGRGMYHRNPIGMVLSGCFILLVYSVLVFFETYNYLHLENYRERTFPIEVQNKRKGSGIIDKIKYYHYYRRGKKLVKQENIEEGIRDLTIAIRSYANPSGAYFLRGRAYFHLGKWKQCVWDMNHTIKAEPQNIQAFFLRAKARMKMGENLQQAKEDIDIAFELEPANEEYHMLATALKTRIEQNFRVDTGSDTMLDAQEEEE